MTDQGINIRRKLADMSTARREGDANAYTDGMVEIWGLDGARHYIKIWELCGHPHLPGDREGFFTDVETLLRLYDQSDEGAE